MTEEELKVIIEKAKKYDELIENRKKTMARTNSKLTPEQRSEAARKAVQARWAKKK